MLADGRLLRLAGLEVAEGARALLARDWVGKTVAVAMLAPRPDRWGRWLADLATADDDSAALDLLSEGVAIVRPEYETRDCEAERLDAEAEAREAKQGLWHTPDAILRASDIERPRALDGRFVMVEGVVRHVGLGRSRIYLDFARRDGFTVIVTRKMEPALARRGFGASEITGKAIRVRGVLETRFGPRIELADPLMLEPAEPGERTKPGG